MYAVDAEEEHGGGSTSKHHSELFQSPPAPMHVMKASLKHRKLLAKATFDNIAESTDELAFRKGEILTVIETDTNGLKGWWLCQLRGRQE
uniref:SH3 domain-containing protein n=1 Tax=Anopheles dirus TaxID=7168 RepID=A0A182N934_9DIPT